VTRYWPMIRSGQFELGQDFVGTLGIGALAGACGGLLLSIAHPVLGRAGVVGEYVTGWVAAFVTLASLYFFRPFVWDSFFAPPRMSYGRMIVPSLIMGSLVTLDVRRAARKGAEWYPGLGAEAKGVRAWLRRRPLTHQIGIAIAAVMLIPVSIRVYAALRPDRITYEEALVLGQQWVEAEPNNARAQHYHATTLLQMRRWEEALPFAERALELQPRYAEPHEVVGWAHLGLGHEEEALVHLTEAARLDMDNARLWRDVGRRTRT
jgi:tetratricopeptide (TPR) repeat protein